MGITDFLQSNTFQTIAPALANTFLGLTQIQRGIDISNAGFGLQADSYNQLAASSRAVANYNASLDQLATSRRINALSRSLSQTTGTQSVQMAGSGFRASSKSYLQIKAESLDIYAKTVYTMRSDSKQRQEMIKYEGKVAEVNAKNAAKAASYNAAVSSSQGLTQQFNAVLGGLVTGASLLL